MLSEHANPLAALGGVDAGGQNVYVREVAGHLGRLGLEVDVFTRRDGLDTPEVTCLPGNVRVVTIAAGEPRFLTKDELWPLMDQFMAGVETFIKRQTLPYHILHGNFWMSGWVALELGRRLNIPTVQIFHAMGLTKQRMQGGADTSPAERLEVERQVVSGVDRIIAQCPGEWRELVEDYGADPESIAVIPSAVDVELFRPKPMAAAREMLGIPLEQAVVGYVGRLLPRKDVRNLLRAVALLRDTEPGLLVVIVGGETRDPDPQATPEIGELQRLASELGVGDRIRFTGKRHSEELADYYSACNLLVTTPWYEPFGLTPLEAMACGRPVIGSQVGGIAFTVVDGETGLLVPPKDPASLGAAITRLLHQPEEIERMGRNARMRVESEFRWEVTARRTFDLYSGLLKIRGSGAGSKIRDIVTSPVAVGSTGGSHRTASVAEVIHGQH